jgi:hypothetical protein
LDVVVGCLFGRHVHSTAAKSCWERCGRVQRVAQLDLSESAATAAAAQSMSVKGEKAVGGHIIHWRKRSQLAAQQREKRSSKGGGNK